jgi:hypothetical protein
MRKQSSKAAWPTPRGQDSYERRNWKTIKKVNEEGGDLTLTSKIKYMEHSSTKLKFLPTSPNSQPQICLSQSTLSLAVFPAKTSATQGSEKESKPSGAVSGLKCFDLSASYDLATSSWKMSMPSLTGGLIPFSARLPKSGMMRSGHLYELQMSVRRIEGNGSLSWPTPQAMDVRTDIRKPSERSDRANKGGCSNLRERVWLTPQGTDGWRSDIKQESLAKRYEKHPQGNLAEQVAHNVWPTPRASEYKGCGPKGSKSQKFMLEKKYLCATVCQTGNTTQPMPTQHLNPLWVEWLQGFPIGWTELSVSETLSFPSKRGKRSSGLSQSSKS